MKLNNLSQGDKKQIEKRLLRKQIVGFHVSRGTAFDSSRALNRYIGKLGKINSIDFSDNTVFIEYGNGDTGWYPLKTVLDHLDSLEEQLVLNKPIFDF